MLRVLKQGLHRAYVGFSKDTYKESHCLLRGSGCTAPELSTESNRSRLAILNVSERQHVAS